MRRACRPPPHIGPHGGGGKITPPKKTVTSPPMRPYKVLPLPMRRDFTTNFTGNSHAAPSSPTSGKKARVRALCCRRGLALPLRSVHNRGPRRPLRTWERGATSGPASAPSPTTDAAAAHAMRPGTASRHPHPRSRTRGRMPAASPTLTRCALCGGASVRRCARGASVHWQSRAAAAAAAEHNIYE